MPYMLQPKNYVQIARPNLYNVAYRRVGAYKGMGRLHPTNYLEIGVRPNRIGATSGQYNTASGQLSLLPPSLRGLGQGAICPSAQQLQQIIDPTDPCQNPTAVPSDLLNLPTVPSVWSTPLGMATLQPGALTAYQYAVGAPLVKSPGALSPLAANFQKYLPYIIGGGLFLVLLTAVRR
jgi:hypothetical protein